MRKKKKHRATTLPRGQGLFNLLRLLSEVLRGLDSLFLRRRQTYYVAASAALPDLAADETSLSRSLTHLIGFAAGRAPLGGRLEIAVTEARLGGRAGVELCLVTNDDGLRGVDRDAFFRELYFEHEAGAPPSLASIRQQVTGEGGQFWCASGKGQVMEYHLFLPVATREQQASPSQQTYRYKIIITNFPRLRKAYGIQKCTALVNQVGEAVRALIRQPLDVVLIDRDQGLITALYETVPGSAESVAGRISRRLATEIFRMGRRPVEVHFRYHLEFPRS